MRLVQTETERDALAPLYVTEVILYGQTLYKANSLIPGDWSEISPSDLGDFTGKSAVTAVDDESTDEQIPTAKSVYDYGQSLGGGGGGASGRSGGIEFGGQNVGTTEQVHAALKIPAGLASSEGPGGIWAIRFHMTGLMKGGTSITFQPRLRLGATNIDVTGTAILVGPAIVSANNTDDQFFRIEGHVYFTGVPDESFAYGSIEVLEHISDAGGAPKENLSTTFSYAGLGDMSQDDKYINLTWKLSGTTGGPSINSAAGYYQLIDYVEGNPV